jgi:hypothetical protein
MKNDKVWWLMFYEDGKFSNAIGNPHFTEDSAMRALAVYYSQMQHAGFEVTVDEKNHGITYDRYGTPCSIRIEEKGMEED